MSAGVCPKKCVCTEPSKPVGGVAVDEMRAVLWRWCNADFAALGCGLSSRSRSCFQWVEGASRVGSSRVRGHI
jgi:hypothetical protein